MLGLVLGLSALTAACGSTGVTGGPLKERSGGNSSTGTEPIPVGKFFDVGVIPPRNPAKEDAIFDRLEPADADTAKGLELRYAVIRLGPGLCAALGASRGWPPTGECKRELLPVKGYHYRPGEQVYVLVGARSSRPGRWLIPAFRLHYRVGDKSYATTYKEGLELKVRAG